jgi:hypothetical protein
MTKPEIARCADCESTSFQIHRTSDGPVFICTTCGAQSGDLTAEAARSEALAQEALVDRMATLSERTIRWVLIWLATQLPAEVAAAIDRRERIEAGDDDHPHGNLTVAHYGAPADWRTDP